MTATLEELLTDPATPDWAKEVIVLAGQVDPVDAAYVLQVISEAFEARCQAILMEAPCEPRTA